MYKLPGINLNTSNITPKNYQEEPVGVVSFDFIRRKVYDKLRLCTAHRDSKIFVWSYSGLTDGWSKTQCLNLAKKSSISSVISVDYIPEVGQLFFSDTHGFIWN